MKNETEKMKKKKNVLIFRNGTCLKIYVSLCKFVSNKKKSQFSSYINCHLFQFHIPIR